MARQVWRDVAADEIMSLLFTLFLALFVLAGIAPALQRTYRRVVEAYREFRQFKAQEKPTVSVWQEETPPLDVYQGMVLKHVARAGRRSLSREALVRELGIDTETMDATTRRLLQLGMIREVWSIFPGARYSLSVRGRRYALRQGLLPTVR